jgi:hypothetical protein
MKGKRKQRRMKEHAQEGVTELRRRRKNKWRRKGGISYEGKLSGNISKGVRFTGYILNCWLEISFKDRNTY